MEYLGLRPGVCLNENTKHGLFGKVMGQNAEGYKNIYQLSNYIENKTLNNTNTYRAILSLREDEALQYGYDDPNKWRELVRSKMADVAEEYGIKIQDLEYTAAIHFDCGHPHCHIMFWDRAQGIKTPFIFKEQAERLKVKFKKEIEKDELAAFHELKNEARKNVLEYADNDFSLFLKEFADLTPKEYTKIKDELKTDSSLADSKLMYNRFSSEYLTHIGMGLLELKKELPKKGRLNYKLLTPDVKEKAKNFVKDLISNNKDIEREVKIFVNANIEMAKIYSDDPKKWQEAGEKAYKDITQRIANRTLTAIKQMNKQSYKFDSQIRKNEEIKRLSISLLKDIFSDISRDANAEERKLLAMTNDITLSKQARKELAIKLENSSGYDWERD